MPSPVRSRVVDPEPLALSTVEVRLRVQDFLRETQKSRSPETVGTYRRSLNEFERWLARRSAPFRFVQEEVEAYKAYLSKERGLHEVSVSTYLTALRRFCQFLVDLGVLGANPAATVKGNRRPGTHSRNALTQEEIGRLTGALGTDSQIERRDRAIVFLMLFAGLSEIEIVRADLADLEQTLMGWYLRVQGKGHTAKDQQVPVDPPVMDAIRLYLDTRGRIRPEDPLFVSHGHRSEGDRLNTRSVRSRVGDMLRRARVKRSGISPHSLTHTAALIWLGDGMPIDEVRRRMRHGTLDTTMIYLKRQSQLAGSVEAPAA